MYIHLFFCIAQRAVYKTAFDEFDADRSGSIDGSELSALFASLGWNDPDGSLVDRALKFLDKDVSSVIEFEEFLRFAEFSWKFIATNQAKSMEPEIKRVKKNHGNYKKMSLGDLESFDEDKKEEAAKEILDMGFERKRGVYKAAFDKFDEDKSGSIDGSEFASLFASLGWNDPDGTLVDRALKFLDKDVSSVIEFDEFLRFAEFSWKFIATNQMKSVEPGMSANKAPTRKTVSISSLSSFDESDEPFDIRDSRSEDENADKKVRKKCSIE
jgi:Ca2+-binding EF-hand superfamily protein